MNLTNFTESALNNINCICCFQQSSSSHYACRAPTVELMMVDDDVDSWTSVSSIDFYADINMRISGIK